MAQATSSGCSPRSRRSINSSRPFGVGARAHVPEGRPKLEPRHLPIQECNALLRAHEQMKKYKYDDGGRKYQQRETAGFRGGVCAMRKCRLTEQTRRRGNGETQHETGSLVFHCAQVSRILSQHSTFGRKIHDNFDVKQSVSTKYCGRPLGLALY